MKKIRVAIWFDAPLEYTGGVNYILNLLFALKEVDKDLVDVYLFFSNKIDDEKLIDFAKYSKIIKTSILARGSISWMVHKVLVRFFNTMFMMNYLLKNHSIDFLSHFWFPFVGRRITKVSVWIPDFQYLHFPEMFPGINVEDENNTKLRMSSNCDAIILSSLDAKKDLISITGPAVNNQRISVLNFVSQPSELEINPHEFNEFLKLYDIPDKFFICPNQFWKHKNHEVIIEAIRELKCQGIDVCVIMTGNPVDYRLEGTPYINHLMELVSAYNLTNQIKILGLVDYKFLGHLMRKSIALINPSKFEGWSSSVEEAKSLGKQVILSSIEVHHEQAPNHGYFFKSNDAYELAGILGSTWREFSHDDDKNRMIAAEKLLHERTVEFGNKYLKLILDTIETKRLL